MKSLDEICQRVFQFIDDNKLFSGLSHIDAALSGGADSVCLLALLAEYRCRSAARWTLRAHHIRHGLRVDDGADAARAEEAARIIGVPYIQTQLHLGSLQADVENTARVKRYEALMGSVKQRWAGRAAHAVQSAVENLAEKSEAIDNREINDREALVECMPSVGIALAHHGDDNIETALWRLGRGCGLEGVCMSVRRCQDGIAFLRPLLSISKDEIYQFVRERSLPWAEDPTNSGDHYKRNRYRHDVVPLLQREAASPHQNYASLLRIRRDADALIAFADAFAKAHYNRELNVWHCHYHDWNGLNGAAQNQVLRHAARLLVRDHEVSEAFVCKAVDLASGSAAGRREWADGVLCFRRYRDGVMFSGLQPITAAAPIPLSVPAQNINIRGFGHVSVFACVPSACLRNTPQMMMMAADDSLLTAGRLQILPASRFQTIAASDGHSVKMREALRSQGAADIYRPLWPVLCADDVPLWVLGGMRTVHARPVQPNCQALCVLFVPCANM